MKIFDFRKKNNGFTLVEIVSALVLVTIVTGMAGVGIYAFFYKFKELLELSEFNEKAYSLIEDLKYGKTFSQGAETEFLGIANAVSISLSNFSNVEGYYRSITCKPPAFEAFHKNDYIKYYLDTTTNSIRMSSLRGFASQSNVRIFPSKEFLDSVVVKKFGFKYIGESQKIVSLEFESEITLSKDPELPKRKTIRFNTIISLAE